MTTELSLAEDVTPTSWQPSAPLTWEEWEQAGNTLLAMDKSLNWWIGDWLNYGEAKWGEMYTQAEAITGWGYDRLARAKWVAAKVPFCLRRQNLSWTCHMNVAHLPTLTEQAYWLDVAEGEGLHSAELKKAIRVASVSPPIPPAPPDEDEDDVPYSGSGPDNYSADAPVEVVEYEQAEERWHDDDLPVLSWETMAEVQALVQTVLLQRWDDAFALASELEGKVMR